MPGGPSRAKALARMSRLHWLSRAGVVFSFDVAAEINSLRAFAPEWTEEAGDHAADSHAPKVYGVVTDTDPEPLLKTPISELRTKAHEVGRIWDRVQRDPFRGLAECRPIHAFAALTHVGRRGEAPRWYWSAFLYAERQQTILFA